MYLHIICVCVSVLYMLYLFRYLLSESSTAYVGHAEIHCVYVGVCLQGGKKGAYGEISTQQGTMPQMQLGMS